jgi:hypothetical protein
VTKINIDEGVARDQKSGVIAVVARLCSGEYLGAFVAVISGIGDPKVLEARAVRKGLCLADDLLIRQVRIASVCQVSVKAMEENLGRYSHILHEIKALSMAFE